MNMQNVGLAKAKMKPGQLLPRLRLWLHGTPHAMPPSLTNACRGEKEGHSVCQNACAIAARRGRSWRETEGEGRA